MPWNKPGYGEITDVEFIDPYLLVMFADWSHPLVDPARLLPPSVAPPDWTRVKANGFEIVAPSPEGEVSIPWDRIRVLTDPEFAAYMAQAAEDEARKIGQRIRALRLQRGLTGKELAERAGIAPQSLSRIEHGKHDIVLITLRRILAAMGASLRDLVSDEDQETARRDVTRTG